MSTWWSVEPGATVTAPSTSNRRLGAPRPLRAASVDMADRLSLVTGALALLATFGLRLLSPRRALTGLFCILAVAAVLAVLNPVFITQKMIAMIHPGVTPTAEFRKLHGLSMMASTVEAILLLIAGIRNTWDMVVWLMFLKDDPSKK